MPSEPWEEIARLCEEAREPDPWLNEAIHVLVGGRVVNESNRFVPPYTASVEAILALIAEKLPGWRCHIRIEGDGTNDALLEDKGDFNAVDARHTRSWAVTPALALCAAFARAMAHQARAEEG